MWIDNSQIKCEYGQLRVKMNLTPLVFGKKNTSDEFEILTHQIKIKFDKIKYYWGWNEIVNIIYYYWECGYI